MENDLSQISSVGVVGHGVRPFAHIPENWPVYEVYGLNVRADMLKPSAPTDAGGRTNWGRFVDRPVALHTKRLLYLLVRAAERALQCPTGNPEHLAPPGAKAKEERAAKTAMHNAIGANPRGKVLRPPGVAGATYTEATADSLATNPWSITTRELFDDLKSLVSRTPDHAISALPTDSGGLFMYRDARPRESAVPGTTGAAAIPDMEGFQLPSSADSEGSPRPQQVLARRISILVEELAPARLTPRSSTAGWRWWILVHDPRIVMTQWIRRVMEENAYLRNEREEYIRKCQVRGAKVPPRLREPFADAHKPECYRYFCTVDDVARAMDAYVGSGTPGGWRALGTASLKDAPAAARGITAPTSTMHPARVFSPHRAMEVYASRVCDIQKTATEYINGATAIQGSFPRPSRVVAYDSMQMTPLALHELALPTRPHRTATIGTIIWDRLRTGQLADALPLDIRQCIDDENMSEAIQLYEDPRVWERSGIDEEETRSRLWASITEGEIEAHERAAFQAEREAVMRPRKRKSPDADAEGLYGVGADGGEGGDEEGGEEEEEEEVGLSGARGGADDESRRLSPCVGGGLGDPEGEVDMRKFTLMKQAEEIGSAITVQDIRRSPLLRLRMENYWAYRLIQRRYDCDTPQFRRAMENFRTSAVRQWWSTILAHIDNPLRLSGPVREGVKFLLSLNQSPNLIQRHAEAVRGEWSQRRRERETGERNLFLSMLQSNDGGGSGGGSGSGGAQEEGDPAAAAAVGMEVDEGAGAEEAGMALGAEADAANLQPLWHEWPIGAYNLTGYGNWATQMHHKGVMMFRCRPGEGPNLLRRMLYVQTSATTYRWGIGLVQLMHGAGGTGKSFIMHCLYKQSFPGQMEFWDHVTERSLAADQDLNDLLILIEEVHARFLGQDEKGNIVSGDELLKSLLTRHQLVTQQLHNDDDGNRMRIRAVSRLMVSFILGTNIPTKNLPDGTEPAILRRYMKDHVGWGKQEVPLAAINNPLSTEDERPEQVSYYHQLSVTNVLCMLVEKLIESRVLFDVNTDICSWHFDWYFDRLHKECQVPKVSSSNREMLVQACRQVCIRYAVHRVFFSETAGPLVRCRQSRAGKKRQRNAGGGHGQAGEWEARPFDPAMLLQVQPFLVVTEEMMADVLTTMRTTYIPTTRWGVLKIIHSMCTTGAFPARKIAYNKLKTLWNEPRKQKRARRRRQRRLQQQQQQQQQRVPTPPPVPIATGSVGCGGAEGEEGVVDDSTAQEAGDPFFMGIHDASGDASDADLMRLRQMVEGEDAQFRLCNDKNYYAIPFSDLTSACDAFSSDGRTSIGSSVFRQVLMELKHERVWHLDRNRPDGHEDRPEAYQSPEGGLECVSPTMDVSLTYSTKIQSPVVVIENDPQYSMGGGGSGGGGFRHRMSRGGGGAGGLQISILADYLEQKRIDSVNDLLAEGLSYRGAREREIVTGCGVTDRCWVHNKGEQEKRAMLSEYMNVIHIKPNHDHVIERINHFPESDLTDSFVFNQSLNSSGTGAREWGAAATDMARRIKICVTKCLDETVMTDYWHRAGLPIRQEYYPWEHTRELRDIASRGVDRLGVPTSSRMKQRYPDDFRYKKPHKMRVGARRSGPAMPRAMDGGGGGDDEEEAPSTIMEETVDGGSDDDGDAGGSDESEADSEDEDGIFVSDGSLEDNRVTRGNTVAAAAMDHLGEDELTETELMYRQTRTRSAARS